LVTTRGGWLPGTLKFLGILLVALALVSMAGRRLAEGMFDDFAYYRFDWYVYVAALVLGSILIWLSRR
jgi:hypothetical protein